MRRFRFVGDSKNYGNRKDLLIGNDYHESYKPFPSQQTTLKRIFTGDKYSIEKQDWIEVFDEPQVFNRVHFKENPIHKDTDLGYLSMKIISELVAHNHDLVCGCAVTPQELSEISIVYARELIKQLDEQNE